MAALVYFHAHPDDETIVTAGTMAKYAAAGHRVVLVVATKGEHGEVPDGFLDDGEELWQRRVEETLASARTLGVARVEFLGYVDSGMMGTPENEASESFWQADVEEAAARLAAILRDEGGDVLVIYDENGNYGHPDHIQVHRVGVRAAELAGTPVVYEATMNRDHIKRMMKLAGFGDETMEVPEEGFVETLGVTEDRLTHAVDVDDWAEVKRASMAAHASQIGDTSFFLSMPDDAFRESFGREWFIRRGMAPRPVDDWLGDLLDG